MDTEAPTNPLIDPDALPAPAEVDYQPISPRYQWVLVLHIALYVVLALALALSIGFMLVAGTASLPVLLQPLLVGPVAVTALVAGAVWARLAVRHKGYAVRERDVFYRRGVIWRSYIAVPFSRVQHVETHQGPLDRWLGLAAIKVYTAGAARADLQIPGLHADTAERLHGFLLTRAGEANGDA